MNVKLTLNQINTDMERNWNDKFYTHTKKKSLIVAVVGGGHGTRCVPGSNFVYCIEYFVLKCTLVCRWPIDLLEIQKAWSISRLPPVLVTIPYQLWNRMTGTP